ncbi:acetolactate synthase 2 small subunit [Thalassomonas sp. M1454]|uniref:acetolactate synthase 2 small subunit n=1 Tax=Thalassomonas sp. M1454 TaxID=2594477 RepID=UPI00117EDD65|nr:acetolactate synthase 2 small subunit [Thalassomonas sp. M1454]TRX58040.1 acetolactate synthase 2 small subunit [Thalassomonas sp. M1454]
MPLQTFKITARQQPLVMERLLQVVRYRCFTLHSVSMFPNNADDELSIELSVDTDKSVENLKKQLLKIIDIKQITVEDQARQKIIA